MSGPVDAGLRKFHASLNVSDLERSIAFYTVLLGAPPAKVRSDYAKFELSEPPLVLSLIPGRAGAGGNLNHVGLRVRNADEVEHVLGIPLLARLPKPSRATKGLAMLSDPNDVDAEAVRRLRTSLELANLGVEAKSIMVTSPAAVQGKSTTIANLAVALARAGQSVALVDLDLRQPVLASFFGVDGHAGVTDVALGRTELEDTLVLPG